MKLRIRNKTFTVKVVTSDEDMEKGLQGVKKLPKGEGMLFMFDKPLTTSFWMKDTEIDLDIIFIDEEKEIIDICHGKAGNDEDAFEEDDVKYVLEINPGFNFRPGEEVEFLNNEMHVLDSTGKVQMKLKGGERIFSRKNTKTLVNMANRANRTKTDSDYKRLGKKIFAYLDIQDSNDPEYVYMEK